MAVLSPALEWQADSWSRVGRQPIIQGGRGRGGKKMVSLGPETLFADLRSVRVASRRTAEPILSGAEGVRGGRHGSGLPG